MSKKSRQLDTPESLKNLKQRNIDCSVLLEQGVIVELEMGRWRASKRLVPEDVGLDRLDRQFVQGYLNLGFKTLIPPKLQKEMNSIESYTRAKFWMHTFRTPFGFFCPMSAYPILEDEMKKRKALWFEKRDQLSRGLAKHEKEIRKEYRNYAEQMYHKLRLSTSHRGRKIESRQAIVYARNFARRIINNVPTPELVRQSFKFEFHAFRVPLPTVLKDNLRKRYISDAKAKQIEEMNRRIAQKYEEENGRLVDGFLGNVHAQLMDMVHEGVTHAMKQINSSERLTGKGALQLRNLVERYRMMNFVGNSGQIEQMEKELTKLDTEIDKKYSDRDLKSIQRHLERLQSMSRESLLDLGLSRSEGSRIELEPLQMDKEVPSLHRSTKKGERVLAMAAGE